VGTRHLNQAIWFPKLYPNKEWANTLSPDSNIITSQKIVNGKIVKKDSPRAPIRDRIVFAHYKNIFGQTVYKFYGIYRTDLNASDDTKHVHKRIKSKISLSDYI